MTYRVFLLAVLVPQLTAAALVYVYFSGCVWATRPKPHRAPRRATAYVSILSLVAVAYTMPWDRWLIRHGVWTYPPGSVLGTIGSVPIEEYLFMIGQTALVTLWCLAFIPNGSERPLPQTVTRPTALRTTSSAGWLAAAAAGLVLAAPPHSHWLYLGAIITWDGPALALQAAVGADGLRRARRARLAGLTPTLPLWASDALAIHAGAWRISPTHTLGRSVLGLPVEEALFFLLTNLLVVDSVVLLADETVTARTARWARRLSAVRPGLHRPEKEAREASQTCERSRVPPGTSSSSAQASADSQPR